MKAAALILASFVGLGCYGPESESTSLQRLDFAKFEESVQPIVAERCANPSCHGRSERPLALYAPLRFRADPSRQHLDEPLFQDELDHNYIACLFFSSEASRPADSLLLAKPLAKIRYHGGGAVFDSTDDHDYQEILAWIAAGNVQGGEP